MMQEWKEKYDIILKNSKIEELLSGLYVDDGRGVHRLLKVGERFVKSENKFMVIDDCIREDTENERGRKDITKKEILKAMNSVNDDLSFTMEMCEDFEDNRMPTLSFSMWLDEN